MMQLRSILNVADNSGAKSLVVIHVFGGSKRRFGRIGDIMNCVVKEAQPHGQVKDKGNDSVQSLEQERLAGLVVVVRILPGDHLAGVEQALGVCLALERELDFVGLLHASFLERVAVRVEDRRSHLLMDRHDLFQALLGREPHER